MFSLEFSDGVLKPERRRARTIGKFDSDSASPNSNTILARIIAAYRSRLFAEYYKDVRNKLASRERMAGDGWSTMFGAD
jgi:hypothetical protein